MKAGSLFAGIGGIDLAFEQAGFDLAFANEIDRDACKTYRHNFRNGILIEGDIRKLNADSLPDIDVLLAGFPCQPFSVCGKQEGFTDNRGNLFFEIMRVIDAKQPQVVFLENVANLVQHDNGKTFLTIHNELVSRGYIIRYAVIDACDYGIPQHRTRTYIVAFLDEEAARSFAFPKQVPLEKRITDLIDRSVKAPEERYLKRGTIPYERLYKFITDDTQLYRFSDYGIQASKDGIAFTLKANMGTWHDRIPFIKDNFGIRTLSPNECLKFMGFPKEFEFPPQIQPRAAYKQCGNSVIVPLIRRIAEQIIICCQ